jgi:two-component system cell cycle sensor histidine kinase PleC
VVSNTLMMFLMLLVIAVSSMLAANLPIAALAATAPVTVAIALNFVLSGTFDNYVLAVLALAAEGYFALLAHRLHSTTLATLEARAEKDALIGELEQAKSISDEARHRAESANVAKSRTSSTKKPCRSCMSSPTAIIC